MSNTFSLLSYYFGFTFVQRAVIAGVLISLCAALLGVSLVLKRYSMIGDGLSHVGFGATAIAAALNLADVSLYVSIPIVVVSAFFLLRLSENSKIKGDAAIGIISSGALAIGTVIISFTNGMNTDVCNYLFGSPLTMTRSDVYLSVGLSVVVILLYVLFYNKIFAVTFDENFMKATGLRANLYNTVIAVLTAVTIVLGMKVMGALLISALIIFPAVSSMRLCKSFFSVTISSAIISVVCFLVGLGVSCVYVSPNGYTLPTGATIVIMNIIVFVVFTIIHKIRKMS
ncbi:MAG: metal ABC transporter permease [Clostridia bacterium]|nr:metal ABC transporter permease [Clostridia bacterium]